MLKRAGPAKTGGRILLIPAKSGEGLPRADNQALLRSIRSAHDQVTIVASVCAGAAWIAAAGLDRGRPLTTHWNLGSVPGCPAPGYQRRRIGARDRPRGHGWSAGGLLSWVDLGLHLVRRFWGEPVADEVARILISDGRRG